MWDVAALKTAVAADIDAFHDGLAAVSRQLHAHPEVAFEERRASALLSDFLIKNGFDVEKGICGLPTAFRGTCGKGKPVIAFLAEYDALPKLGHPCGHNLIAVASLAAAPASRRAGDAA